MNKKTWFSIMLALALTLGLSGLAIAQEITGTISGTVTDSSGGAVAGATVIIMDADKNDLVVRTLTTNGEGAFTAPNLASGNYKISYEAANFKKTVKTDVKLSVGDRRTVDAALEAGNISETVTVQADAVAIDLTSAASGTVITGNQVRELPINNRNFVQLITLAPGVSGNLSDQVYAGTTNPEGQANTMQISVNGARSSQNTYTVDGADITDRGSNLTIQAYPSVDSIGEFRVLRSLFPAESGRSGGGQVNVVTRSGTDEFHGSFFEFVRNEKFNANTYFNNQNAPLGRDADGKAIRAPFRYNNFGWTVGGPIYFLTFGERSPDESYFGKIPKTYFFFSQEFRKDIRYPTLVSTVPSAGLRQGIFTTPICIQAVAVAAAPTTFTCDPLVAGVGGAVAQVLPANTSITTMRPINPLAQQYIQHIYNNIPLPNNGQFGLNFPTRNLFDFRQEILKIDTSLNNNWTAYYRLQRDKIPTEEANALFSSGASVPEVSRTSTDSPGRTHTFQTTYVFSPKVILEANYNFGYGAILSENIGLLALSRSPITPPLPYANQRDRVPTISGNGFSALQSFGPYDNFSWKQNIGTSLTWVIGDHNTKYGVIWSKYRKNENALAGSNEGIYSGFNTPGSNAATIAPSGNTIQQQWANFLLGTNAAFTQASFDYTADLRQMTFEGYAQDEWRVRPNLTLYMGVRYSFFGSPYDNNGRLTNFVPELWDPAQAPVVAGNSTRIFTAGKNFCNGIIINTQNFITGPEAFRCNPTPSPYGKFVVKAPKTDFAPRVGLAWDPFSNGETSIRTGYGIYHDQVLNGTLLQQIGLNQPYQQTCTVTGINIANPVPGGNCTVASSTTVANVRGLQAEWQTPYVQHWSFDVQQQLGRNTVVTAGYYGSKGVNLIGAFEMNEVPEGYARSLGATGCAATTSASATGTVPCQANGQVFLSAAANNILDQIRPFEGYRSVALVQPRFNSIYHSLQISGQHRFSGNSVANIAYTYAKNYTDNQTDRSTAPQNSYDIQGDWGRAALDRRHILTGNYIYELPFFNKSTGVTRLLLGGWQVQGIATYQTGLPLTVTTSNFDPAGLGFISALVAGGRPYQICADPNANAPHGQQWIQPVGTAAVPNPDRCFNPNPTAATGQSNTIGNTPRGSVFGPSTKRVDFVLAKYFKFTEDVSLQLRAESFNVFNWTSFTTVSTNVTAANFGQVTGTRDPRTFQFGAKLYW